MPAVTLLAANTTVPGPQVEPGVVVGTAEDTAFTDAITAFRGELLLLSLHTLVSACEIARETSEV